MAKKKPTVKRTSQTPFLSKKLATKEVFAITFFLVSILGLFLVMKILGSVTQTAPKAALSSAACQAQCNIEGYKTGTCASNSSSTTCFAGQKEIGRTYCPKYHLGKWNTICCCSNKYGDKGVVTPKPTISTPQPDLTVDKVWFTCMEGINEDGSYSGQYTWDVKAQVSNLGKAFAKNITSLYWNNGQYEGSRGTDFFSPAGNKNFVTRDVWFINIGAACGKNADGSWQTRNIKVCVNPSLEYLKADPTVNHRSSLLKKFGKVLDSNYDNNCLVVKDLSCDPKNCCMAGCTPPCCDPNKQL